MFSDCKFNFDTYQHGNANPNKLSVWKSPHRSWYARAQKQCENRSGRSTVFLIDSHENDRIWYGNALHLCGTRTPSLSCVFIASIRNKMYIRRRRENNTYSTHSTICPVVSHMRSGYEHRVLILSLFYAFFIYAIQMQA